ncbi:hypothetical protein A2U01_0102336, partial [Trifolium medium]|nr:hypothetical protein [Trifolium medium]
SCNAAHIESQPSPAQNPNIGAAGGCEVEPDAASAGCGGGCGAAAAWAPSKSLTAL